MTTTVLYDPQARCITLAVTDLRAITLLEEDDVTLITFEDVDEVEFVWPPDEKMWRAV
jgi:hypothetical protein